jgi:hypothetical protein
MIDRFLKYSLQHGKKIKAMWLEGDEIKQGNITVKEIKNDVVYYTSSKSKTPKTINKQQLLSLGYARGDSGETI